MNALRIIKNDFQDKKNQPLENFLADQLVISTQSTVLLIDIEQILYIRAESNYSRVVTSNDHSILSTSILKKFEKHLSEKMFFRVHASYLINLNQLDHIKKNGVYSCVLKNGVSIPVSKKYKESFISVILSQKV